MPIKTLKILRMGRISAFACVLILFHLIPTGSLEGSRTICIFKNLLGIECPGCGMGRAFSSIMHGDLNAAISYNGLVLIVFPLFCFILLKDIVSLLGEFIKSRHSGDLSRRSLLTRHSFSDGGWRRRKAGIQSWHCPVPDPALHVHHSDSRHHSVQARLIAPLQPSARSLDSLTPAH